MRIIKLIRILRIITKPGKSRNLSLLCTKAIKNRDIITTNNSSISPS